MKQNILDNEDKEWFMRFRWFFTSHGLLVIGGKNAKQNELIIKEYANKDDLVLHTEMPGSPFCIIKSKPTDKPIDFNKKSKKISKQDIEEAAIFCACFSQAWKKKLNQVSVSVFKPTQIYKTKRMPTGTFGIRGKCNTINVRLELAISMQHGKIRAVPLSAATRYKLDGYRYWAIITPGDLPKEQATKIIGKKIKQDPLLFFEISKRSIKTLLHKKISKSKEAIKELEIWKREEEIMQALPAGKFDIRKIAEYKE